MSEENGSGHSEPENRGLFRRLWKRAKAGDFEGLEGEPLRMARALRQHAEEFGDFFETMESSGARTVERDGEEVDPVLHITAHAIVEAQLEARDPVEVFQFYRSMLRKGRTRHESVHLIGAVLMPLVAESVQRMSHFDNERYARLLRRVRSMNPDRIWDRLDEVFEEDEREFGLTPALQEEEGPCRHCGAEAALDEHGFCEACGDRFERDMLRLRRWENSLTASYLEPESYERLRLDTIEQFGRELELITEEEAERWRRPADR